MADEYDSDDDDEPKLSASTLAALHEFYAEHSVMLQETCGQEDINSSRVVMPAEDWVCMICFDLS